MTTVRSIVPPPIQEHRSATWSVALPGTLELHFVGPVDGLRVAAILAAMRIEVGRRVPRALLFDAARIGRISSDVRDVSLELLRYASSIGIERSIVITTSPAARMLGSALALGSGLPLEFVETREEAHARLGARLRG